MSDEELMRRFKRAFAKADAVIATRSAVRINPGAADAGNSSSLGSSSTIHASRSQRSTPGNRPMTTVPWRG